MSDRLKELEQRIKCFNSETISFDEVRNWRKGELDELVSDRVLEEIELSKTIVCDQCPDHCTIEPERRTIPQTGEVVGFHVCREKPDGERQIIKLERFKQWRISKDRLIELGYLAASDSVCDASGENKAKKRPKKVEMRTRNKAVAMAAAEYKAEHEVLPTVDDIVNVTEYNRTQIYATDAYKEGKIAKTSAKATEEMTGSSVAQSEYFDENSLQHSRETRRSNSDQAELDGLIEKQREDEGSNFVNG